jgi:hypothetical protein
MKKQIAVREYNFSDAELVTTSNGIVLTARRDATEFGKRNYTETKDFAPTSAQIDAFQAIPTDIEMQGLEEDATIAKDAAKDVVKSQIKRIMSSASNIWGIRSSKYKRFGTKNLDNLSDAFILRCATRVARTATQLLTELAAEGVTTAIISALKDATLDFDNKIDLMLDAKHDRNEMGETRVNAGNALYRKIVKIANVGKNIWAETSEAKYNDYIIYDNPGGSNGGTANTVQPS